MGLPATRRLNEPQQENLSLSCAAFGASPCVLSTTPPSLEEGGRMGLGPTLATKPGQATFSAGHRSIGLNSQTTRSGPKIPAGGPFGGGRFFRLDNFGFLMACWASPWHRRGTCGASTWSWPPWRGMETSLSTFSWPIYPTYQFSHLYGFPMA